jgi:hypothetical protein
MRVTEKRRPTPESLGRWQSSKIPPAVKVEAGVFVRQSGWSENTEGAWESQDGKATQHHPTFIGAGSDRELRPATGRGTIHAGACGTILAYRRLADVHP